MIGLYLRIGAAVAVIAGGWILLARHDAALRAEWKAGQVEAVAAAVAVERAAADAAVAALRADTAARSTANNETRRAIAHAAPSSACVDSPAVRAVLGRLRDPRPGAGPSGNAPGAPVMP